MLSIEFIEGCNFECYFCRAKDLDKNVYMDKELFKSTVAQAKELGIKHLKLTPCKGEPFLHPNVYEMLEYANDNMQEVFMFTNATAINVAKLKAIRRNRLVLCVSYYGSNVEEFTKLTCTNQHLFDIFHRKLKELTDAGIEYEIFRRDNGYEFDYQGGKPLTTEHIDTKDKCKYHHGPKVFANGDVSFCMFAREEWPEAKSIFYTNLNRVSLKEALTDPLRWKFYESQSLCASGCTGYARNCYTDHTITSIKLLAESKKVFLLKQEPTEARYKEIEDEIIQRPQH